MQVRPLDEGEGEFGLNHLEFERGNRNVQRAVEVGREVKSALFEMRLLLFELTVRIRRRRARCDLMSLREDACESSPGGHEREYNAKPSTSDNWHLKPIAHFATVNMDMRTHPGEMSRRQRLSMF